MTMDLLWLIPVLPLIGAAVNGFVGKRLPKNVVAVAAAGSVGISFLISLGLFIAMLRRPATVFPILKDYFTWVQAVAFQASFGLTLCVLLGLFIFGVS